MSKNHRQIMHCSQFFLENHFYFADFIDAQLAMNFKFPAQVFLFTFLVFLTDLLKFLLRSPYKIGFVSAELIPASLYKMIQYPAGVAIIPIM